jgi:hypothetical protein
VTLFHSIYGDAPYNDSRVKFTPKTALGRPWMRLQRMLH